MLLQCSENCSFSVQLDKMSIHTLALLHFPCVQVWYVVVTLDIYIIFYKIAKIKYTNWIPNLQMSPENAHTMSFLKKLFNTILVFDV